LQASFFLTPAKATTWIRGVGPIFQFPTASSPELGTGRWSAGPTAALVYSEGPWFNGILGYQLMSFTGNRDRGTVNQTFLEPDVSYNFESGWYVQCEPSITYDWTAEAANAWTIPMGADIGKAFKLGSQYLSLAGWRVRPPEASGGRPAMDTPRERNVPLPRQALNDERKVGVPSLSRTAPISLEASKLHTQHHQRRRWSWSHGYYLRAINVHGQRSRVNRSACRKWRTL